MQDEDVKKIEKKNIKVYLQDGWWERIQRIYKTISMSKACGGN